MEQTFIKFHIYEADDLFSPGRVVCFRVMDEKPVTEGKFPTRAHIQNIKRRIVKREMLRIMHNMYTVRSNRNTVGYLPTDTVKLLPKVESSIGFAGSITDFDFFMRYVNGTVLPLLWDVRPGSNSTREKYYLSHHEALKSVVTAFLENETDTPPVKAA